MSSSVAKSFLSNFKCFPEQGRNSLNCQTSWHIPHAPTSVLVPQVRGELEVTTPLQN